MKIETLPIGDELLTGRVSDTNSTWVGEKLFEIGQRLERASVILDDKTTIQETLRQIAERADVALVFGGLGPTSDDKTAECAAELLGVPLVEDVPSKERLFIYLKERQRAVTPEALKQILHPQGTEPIQNPKGAAVGFTLVMGNCRFFFLPGVPYEMKAMFLDSVLPWIKEQAGNAQKILHKTWRCHEIPESELQRRMNAIEKSLPKAAFLGYRTRYPENFLTLYWNQDGDFSQTEWQKVDSKITEILKDVCYTVEEKELEELVLARLKSTGKTLALAESCTGGRVADRLTNVPGASEVFKGSTVVYQVSTKEKILGVKLNQAEEAVSQTCTRQLAESIRKKTGASLGAAITGYLGPTAGDNQPVGTLFLCIVGETVFEKKVFLPRRDREVLKSCATAYLLAEIYRFLLKG